ncbi:NADAR family protein [Streptomyces coeruleorubidus]
MDRGTALPSPGGRARDADGPGDPPVPELFPRALGRPGHEALRNDFPAPVPADGVTYPSVGHAYWALSTTDPDARAAIRDADTAYAARGIAAAAPRRDGWEQARTAVMTALLRVKYTRHPALARILLDTHDATLVYDDSDSGFWGDNGGRGRNWTGRLLELVRSELRAEQAGITLPEPGAAEG